MIQEFVDIIYKFESKGIIIDSNVLILLFIGSFNKQLIPSYKRTNTYTIEDYELLIRFLNCFRKRITTPYILSEVSNLSNSLYEDHKKNYFKQFSEKLTILQEEYNPTTEFFNSENPFIKLGVTDAGIASISENKYLVFTDDLPLYNALQMRKIDSIKFSHMKSYNLYKTDFKDLLRNRNF